MHISISEVVNEAVHIALRKDQEGLGIFAERTGEQTMNYEALLKDLESHGKL